MSAPILDRIDALESPPSAFEKNTIARRVVTQNVSSRGIWVTATANVGLGDLEVFASATEALVIARDVAAAWCQQSAPNAGNSCVTFFVPDGWFYAYETPGNAVTQVVVRP